MSESTSAPTGVPAGDAASTPAPANSPPPASQPAISVSDAARLLSNQRRRDGEALPPVTPSTERKPSANEQARQAAQKAPDGAAPAPAATPADTGISALDKALGVPGGAPQPEAANNNDAVLAQYDIDGRRYSQAELREAVLKAADYTAKTQEIAEQRRQMQAQHEALAMVLPLIQPELARLQEMLNAGAARPDIGLIGTDPQRYFQELEQFERVSKEQERLGSLNQVQSQAAERAMAQQVANANEVLAKEFPFWADPVERGKVQQDVAAWAMDKGGFTRDELRGLSDPRTLKAMMKAMSFDRWVAGTRTSAPAVPTAAPVRGARPPAPPTAQIAAASANFDANPSIRNAAALIGARRGTNGR